MRAIGLFAGMLSRGKYETRINELLEGRDAATCAFIGTMLKVRGNMLEGYKALQDLTDKAGPQGSVVPALHGGSRRWSDYGFVV